MIKLPALSVQPIKVSLLKPYKNNAKIHTEEQVNNLADLIEKFGWTQPIVVDKDKVIIVGHGRRLAAIKLGLKSVPVVIRHDLTFEQAQALRLADNKSASVFYDADLIEKELNELKTLDFDLMMTGMSATELEVYNIYTSEPAIIQDLNLTEELIKTVEEKEASVDIRESAVSKAFGFRKVTASQALCISRFMKEIQERLKVKGAEALINFINSQVFYDD